MPFFRSSMRHLWGPSPLKPVVCGLWLVFGYIGLAVVGLQASFDDAQVSAFWPAAGFAVGWLATYGVSLAWAPWVANMAVLLVLQVPMGEALVVASVNLAEYVIAGWAIRFWMHGAVPLSTVRDVAIFFVIAVLAPVFPALVGPWGADGLPFGGDGFSTAALTWWCGDVAGIILVAPLVLVLGRNLQGFRILLSAKRLRLELILGIVVAGFVSAVIFYDPLSLGPISITLAYGVLLILIWASLRLGQLGAILALVAVTLPALFLTSRGYGPFSTGQVVSSVSLLLGFLFIGAGKALFLSSTLMERNQFNAQRKVLALAVEQSATAVIIADAQGIIRYVNSAFCQLTGYQSDEAIGKNPRFLKTGHTSDQEYGHLWKRLSKGQTWRGDFLNRRKDGGYVWEHTVISPLRDRLGQITHFVATAEDITARIQTEQKMRRALDATERSRAELERITFAVTHTLQEPLRSISGFAQLLKKRYHGALDESGVGYVDRIVEGADYMHHLFHDLMHYVMVDEVSPSEEIPLAHVVSMAVGSLGEEAERATTVEDLPTILGVERQLVRVFEHLIGNALKYRSADREPAIKISAQPLAASSDKLPKNMALENSPYALEQAPDEAYWHIIVADNGIGVDPVFIPRLFTLFSRLHTMDRYEGTGVGLAYCRRVIEHHGGHVWMESEPGLGAHVHFVLPQTGKS